MSRKVIFVDSNDKNNKVRLSKPYEKIENKKDDDQNLFFTSVHDKYALRPKHLEHMCLAKFATNYRSVSEQRVDNHLHEDEAEDDDVFREPGSVIKLKDGRGYLCKRQQPAILRYHRFNPPTTVRSTLTPDATSRSCFSVIVYNKILYFFDF